MQRIVICALAALVAACGAVPTLPGVTPHRIEIQQGNYISQEMVAQLKPGMTREQVRYVLGTPLVTDIFHADRWDYVYYRDVQNKPREQRKLSVFFEDGKLARLGGDIVPISPPPPKPAAVEPRKPPADVAKPIAEPPKPEPEQAKPAAEPAKPAADAPAEKGFFGRLWDKLKGGE